MRLNKYISHYTTYSRRDADKLIEAGEVTLNKKVIKDFGYEVKDDDMIAVKGKPVKKRNELTVIVYNKPRGVNLVACWSPRRMIVTERLSTTSFQANLGILSL